MEDFDFDANPNVPAALIHTLAKGAWITAGQPLCLMGDSGTGRSHLLIGLGTAAAEHGHRVRYTTAAALVSELVEAADGRHPSRTIARYGRVDLLCLDELGHLELDRRGAELLFHVFTEREEKASIAIASNTAFSEWARTFTDPRLCAATVDRLTFDAHIIETGSDSYRLKAPDRSAREPPPQALHHTVHSRHGLTRTNRGGHHGHTRIHRPTFDAEATSTATGAGSCRQTAVLLNLCVLSQEVGRTDVRASPASGSLAGRPVALASSGEALELPFVHARQPILAVRGRWADPRVAGNMGVTQGVHVRPILVDPCVYPISSADGPVARDEDIDVVRHALEQPQRGEVVLDRVSGVVQVEHRNQDIRKHVAGDENPAFLDQQRRMARGMRLMLDNPDLRAIPRNLRHLGG